MNPEAFIKVFDNSGAAEVKVIHFFKLRNYTKVLIGTLLKVVIQKLDLRKKQRIENKTIVNAILVKRKIKKFSIYAYTKNNQTGVILLNNTFRPIGTRNFGIFDAINLKKSKQLKILALNIRTTRRI